MLLSFLFLSFLHIYANAANIEAQLISVEKDGNKSTQYAGTGKDVIHRLPVRQPSAAAILLGANKIESEYKDFGIYIPIGPANPSCANAGTCCKVECPVGERCVLNPIGNLCTDMAGLTSPGTPCLNVPACDACRRFSCPAAPKYFCPATNVVEICPK